MTDKTRSQSDDVAHHYGGRDMANAILATLASRGIGMEALRPDHLAPFEEFHIGGRSATEYLVEKLALEPHHCVLDVGCGIGGAVRYIAHEIGCRATGIDITPDFVQAARTLSEAVGLHDRTDFDIGSAVAMPYDAGSFDAVVTIHAAMNIADRKSLYREMARVLKPGGVLALYDVMRREEGVLLFPVPWADSPAISHLLTPEETGALLEQAGMEVVMTEDRTAMAEAFFRQVLTDSPQPDAAPAPQLAMQDAQTKLRNAFTNVERGRIAPVLMVARRRGGWASEPGPLG